MDDVAYTCGICASELYLHRDCTVNRCRGLDSKSTQSDKSELESIFRGTTMVNCSNVLYRSDDGFWAVGMGVLGANPNHKNQLEEDVRRTVLTHTTEYLLLCSRSYRS
mmetsp:Transcript_31667/g.51194  ORF Transcript_31667/g.51194 Transcript_31667/m.51194 type:complete len:108 (-) Transcript_31667:2458-2781(-)